MESKREIIYVDAGSTNSDNFRICLYYMNNDDIQLSWIPREINKIADKNCKLPSTLDNGEFNILNLFIELSKKAYVKEAPKKNPKNEVEKLQQEVEKLRVKVKNQATQINALKKK